MVHSYCQREVTCHHTLYSKLLRVNNELLIAKIFPENGISVFIFCCFFFLLFMFWCPFFPLQIQNCITNGATNLKFCRHLFKCEFQNQDCLDSKTSWIQGISNFHKYKLIAKEVKETSLKTWCCWIPKDGLSAGWESGGTS